MCFNTVPGTNVKLAREMRGDCFVSFTGHLGTYPLVDSRNHQQNGWGRLVTTELGFALLALASLVEAVVRVPLIVVAALVFAGLALYSGLCDGKDLCSELMKALEITAMVAVTVLLNLDLAGKNLVALVQNVLKGDEKLRDRDLEFASLCCCGSASETSKTRKYREPVHAFPVDADGKEVKEMQPRTRVRTDEVPTSRDGVESSKERPEELLA